MTKFFFILAWRNIKNNLLHSIVNITGLSIGICTFFLISLFLKNIYSKDKFNENHERLFILQQKIESPTNGISYTQLTPFPLPEALSIKYPEIENYARFEYCQEQLQPEGKNKIIFEDGIYADSTFCSLLTLKFLAGDKQTALKEPNSIIIYESLKLKLFGDIPDSECIGEIIILSESVACEITAVVEDNKNTSLWYRFIISMPTIESVKKSKFYGNWEAESRSIILLKKNAGFQILNDKISPYLKNLNNSYENNNLFLLPLTDNFLNNPIDTKKKMIVIMAVILTAFILLISYINFVNLRYSNAITRIKEISLQKVLGAKRFKIILQWIGESALITFLAFDLAMIFTELMLPAFNNFTSSQLKFMIIENWGLILIVLSTSIFIGILSGSIPALKISSLKLSSSLHNQFKSPKSKLGARKALLIFQISLTVIFIYAMIIMRMQLNYHINKDKGFDEKGLLTYQFISSSSNRKQIDQFIEFAEELKTNPAIQNISISSSAPFIDFYEFKKIVKNESIENGNVHTAINHVDINYFETLNLRINEGCKFSTEDINRSVCIINEAAKKELALAEPIGKLLQPGNFEIIGVVKNYHAGDLNWPIRPMLLTPRSDTIAYKNNVFVIRIPEQRSGELKAWIENKTKEYFPEDQIEYEWLEDLIPHGFVKALSITFGAFSILAICLSIIGLFGIVSYSTIARSKEIGIRKTMGATSLSIFRLLLKSHIRLVIIANLISWPLAYFMMKTFLQFSEHRINISVFVFIATGLITFLIMFLTVGYHILKASRTNPVKELRYE